jgi:hypothetical protein
LPYETAGPFEHLDEIRHQSLAEHCSRLEERPQIIDEAPREGIEDHREADGSYDRSRVRPLQAPRK